MNEKKSDMFVVTFDKNRAGIIGLMSEISETLFNIEDICVEELKIPRDEVLAFFEEFQKKIHACGFCEDKNCQYNKKSK